MRTTAGASSWRASCAGGDPPALGATSACDVIEPHWKGPELAAMIEKEYKLEI